MDIITVFLGRDTTQAHSQAFSGLVDSIRAARSNTGQVNWPSQVLLTVCMLQGSNTGLVN